MALARVPAGDGLEGRVRSRSCATGEAQAYKGSDGNILNGASGGFPRREGAPGAATSGTGSLKTAALMGRGGKKSGFCMVRRNALRESGKDEQYLN